MAHNLVDPSFELLDPCPNIHALFLDFNGRYFEGALAGCEVKWSPRMTTCAGVCSYEGRGGLCSIRLSKPLLTLRPRKDLVETLLHEMIHAFLFVKQRNRDRDGHGPEFQSHMHRINRLAGTHITIYHTFHQEVALYKQHWWRCNGPCRERRPFHGWVKRASNRAPGPNDRWWAQHQMSCGGVYEKVKEPEGYGAKKKKTGSKEKKTVTKTSPSPTKPTSLDRWVTGEGGKKVGGSATGTNGTTLGARKTDSEESNGTVVPFNGTGQRLGNVTNTAAAPSTAGQRLGGPVRGVSRLLNLGQTGPPRNRSLPNAPSTSSSLPSTSHQDHDVIVLDDSPYEAIPTVSSQSTSDSQFVETQNPDWSLDESMHVGPTVVCPSCDEEVEEYYINDHLDYCCG